LAETLTVSDPRDGERARERRSTAKQADFWHNKDPGFRFEKSGNWMRAKDFRGEVDHNKAETETEETLSAKKKNGR
jgi:hypothetical protein